MLPLRIETGRFLNKIKWKIENVCNSDFLFHCDYYEQERRTFLEYLDNHDFENLHDRNKLNYYFRQRKLSKFACKIFNKRQDKMYATK